MRYDYDDRSPAASLGRTRAINLMVAHLGLSKMPKRERSAFLSDIFTGELGKASNKELRDVINGFAFYGSVLAKAAAQGDAYLPDLDELEEAAVEIETGDPISYLHNLHETTERSIDDLPPMPDQ